MEARKLCHTCANACSLKNIVKLPIPGASLLTPGAVLELHVPVIANPKYKFCVFVAVDDPPLYFLINSEISPYIAERQHLFEQQVTVPSVELDGRLKWESYLDCSQPYDNFSYQELCNAINANPGCFMGRVSDGLKLAIVAVVEASLTLRPMEKWAIQEGLLDQIST